MRDSAVAEILLVEDSPSDRFLAEQALAGAKVANHLTCVEDGVEAIEFLRREGKYAHARRPDLILLDLNLPRKNGREVLAEIKADPVLRSIPVVVLTTSTAIEDVEHAYRLHANCLVQKPIDFDRFVEIVQQVGEFWFAIAKLPPSS